MTPTQRKPIRKVAIANRGEVAVRIIRACQELDLKTVLLHSSCDQKSIAYRLADETVEIGESPSQESYLSIERNIEGALAAGACALHPGFGFLSENASFAKECLKNGIKFIGPSPDSISLFGDKISAKNLVEKLGAQTIPGCDGLNTNELVEAASKMGYPVIVKAAAGGGGRGMKVVRSEKEAAQKIEEAKREALSAFGSDRVFLEKYLDRAKHIEVQIFGTAKGRHLHLWDRECSIQRRHQKIIEEAGEFKVPLNLRKQMCELAVEIAKASNYEGAGTVEFLVQDGVFYFIEMNTRLQVEHPVTEEVLGIDLVKAQLLTAMGEEVRWTQEELTPRGHAIECRLYAEDLNGIPSIGTLLRADWPTGGGRRFEVGLEPGDEMTPFYDAMFAKVIVREENRKKCLEKMLSTLSECILFGFKSNIPFLKSLIAHPVFQEGTMTTRFLDEYSITPSLEPLPEDMSKSFEKEIKKSISAPASSASIAPIASASSIHSPFQRNWSNS